jgi:hypothetical protein
LQYLHATLLNIPLQVQREAERVTFSISASGKEPIVDSNPQNDVIYLPNDDPITVIPGGGE